MKIIGFAGPKGSGKNTVAMIAKQALRGHAATQMVAFATPLKEASARLLGIPSVEDVDDLKLSETVEWRGPTHFNMRTFLQRMGTEVGRDLFGPNFWVDQLFTYLHREAPEVALVTDVRFPNEAKAIIDHGGCVIQIDREGMSYSGEHASEQPLPQSFFAYRVFNPNDDLDHVREQIQHILEQESLLLPMAKEDGMTYRAFSHTGEVIWEINLPLGNACEPPEEVLQAAARFEADPPVGASFELEPYQPKVRLRRKTHATTGVGAH